MEKMIRFGAIGCGSAGTNRINQLAKHELGVKVVAAVDVDPTRLDNLEKVLGYNDFAHYTGEQDFKRMIDENQLDAVGIGMRKRRVRLYLVREENNLAELEPVAVRPGPLSHRVLVQEFDHEHPGCSENGEADQNFDERAPMA